MSRSAGIPAVAVRPGSVRAWVMATRPPTLTAAAAPVLVGTACAHAEGGFAAGPALAALLGAFLLQIGANFANDVFDYEKGADTAERLGPTRAVQAGLLSPRSVRVGMAVVFGLALLVGIYLTVVAGPAIVAIGVLSILSAIAYTGGPYPLGYHGLGDVFVMAFFGFVAVCGTTFVQLGTVTELAVWGSVPVGALATAILVVNNLRDRETDVRAGKRTLAVRFGRSAVLGEYGALLLAAYAVPVGLWALGATSYWVLLPMLSLPLALRLCSRVFQDVGRPLNASLVGTARLLFLFSVLLSAGLAAAPHVIHHDASRTTQAER